MCSLPVSCSAIYFSYCFIFIFLQATVSKKLFSLTEGVERELPVPEEADHSLHATRSSERRAAFSVEDTPIKESEPSRRKTLELRYVFLSFAFLTVLLCVRACARAYV